MINLPEGIDINYLIDDLRIFSWEAADILIFYSNKFRTVSDKNTINKSKSNDDPVTLADLEVNEKIIKRIKDKYPKAPWDFLSEEYAKSDEISLNRNVDWLWIFDPLDGTKDFIQGTSNYAMHLALSYKNKPLIGLVLIPQKDELWISDGDKVWCENRAGVKKNFNLSKNSRLDQMTIVLSKNHSNKKLQDLVKLISFKNQIIMGSIGCKVASILRGESDIYICMSEIGKSSPKDWDFAAPEVILKNSGGEITTIENKDLVYNKERFNQSGIIIATGNKLNHKDICTQIKEVIKWNQFDLRI